MVRKSVNRKTRSRQNRKTRSRQNRKTRSRRNRKGCAARSQNRQSFQRGGMAPFDYKDALLLDQATRTQAGIVNLDQYVAESQVLAKQAGGSRNRSRRNRNRNRSRKQRGGELADFSGSYELLPASVARGVNPQFATEGSVNSLYGEFKGAQGV